MKISDYAKSFIGVPYIYGGNNPIGGMDCSGLVCECLKAVGILSSHEDFTARGLLEHLVNVGYPIYEKPQAEFILFFGGSINKISHVGIAIDDKLMIESGGGDSLTVTIDAAKKSNAFVRIRPIRKDLIVVIRLEKKV